MYSRWYYDSLKVAVATVPLIGIGGAVIANYGYLEIVPYTNRTHFVYLSPLEEREHAESHFASIKQEIAPSTFNQHHTDSIRLNIITSKLVHAVHHSLISKIHGDNAALAVNLGKARSAQPQTGHLDGLDWEVILVKSKRVTVWSLPAGKIIVPTGLLDYLKTDAEIATLIAHEIGHMVARHWSEKIIYKWLPSPLRVPFLRRAEIEADHIGIMLLGAAGFDPRVAPTVFEKLGDCDRSFLSTHPPNKKRAQLLSHPKLMQEALELYREVCPGQDTEYSR